MGSYCLEVFPITTAPDAPTEPPSLTLPSGASLEILQIPARLPLNRVCYHHCSTAGRLIAVSSSRGCSWWWAGTVMSTATALTAASLTRASPTRARGNYDGEGWQ